MNKIPFVSCCVLSLLHFSAKADIISGAVTDSATGKGLYHVKVGTDSLHTVLTDSTGKFSFNTEGTVGIVDPNARSTRRISWEPNSETFFLAGNSGAIHIQIRNMLGAIVAKFASENLNCDSRISMESLPKGIYMAAINAGGRISVRKIMKLRGNVRGFGPTDIQKTSALAKISAVHAATTLNFKKATYYPASMTITGPQSGLAIKLQENFSLSRHDFITAAEWQCYGSDCEHNQKIYLVRGGKIVMTYTEPLACEFDDLWMLSDGSITMSLRYGARKIKSEKDTSTSWYVAENINTQGETHVLQPIALNKVFMAVNQGNNGVAGFIINTQTGDTLKTWKIPGGNTGFHGNLRQCRITKDGTMVCGHFDLNKVAEYDTSTMKEIWSYSIHAWAVVKLRNGNMLVSGDGNGYVREIDRATKTVIWDLDVKTLPNVTMGKYIQGIHRLANGNTIVTNNEGNPAIFEVSPDKKVVWSVAKSVISTSSACQILDEEGVPENPGDLLR
jgi:hypothetical protein